MVYVLSFMFFVLALTGLSAGLLSGRDGIRGSCGGLNAWRDEIGRPMCDACAECPEKKKECELEERERTGAAAKS